MADTADIRLIVGLGNVGAKYAHTRHNMGCDLLELIADHYRIDTVVEVLEYLTDQYRQSKHNYQPWYIALSQIGTCFPQYNLSPSQYYLSSNSILALHIFFKFFTRCLLFSTSLT